MTEPDHGLDVDELLHSLGLARPVWISRAACAGVGPDLFFLSRGVSSAGPARDLCASCPVRDECLAYALEHEPKFGVWAGTTPKERREIRRRRRLAEEEPAA